MTYGNVLKYIALCFALLVSNAGLCHQAVFCTCDGFTLTLASSQIPDGGFQELTCCSSAITAYGYDGFNCTPQWQNFSEETTPDLWNTECEGGLIYNSTMPYPPVNTSSSFVGFISAQDWLEYVGTCLAAPLEAGKNYTLDFSVGFGLPHNGIIFYPGTVVEIVLYGKSSCNSLSIDGNGCPIEDGEGWQIVGTVTVNGSTGQWIDVNISFTPTTEIYSVALGPPCDYSGASMYHFLDDLLLTESFDINETLELAIEGAVCDNITLTVPSFLGIDYQWTLNGEEINGATSHIYTIPLGMDGEYQVVLSNETGCMESGYYTLETPEYVVTIDSALCYGNGMVIGNSTYDVSGLYIDTLASHLGCDSIIELNLVIYDEITHDISIEEVLCFGDSVIVEVSSLASSIVWSDGNTEFVRKLPAGDYQFTLSINETGCYKDVFFTIEQPALLNPNIQVMDAFCIDNADGEIAITPLGGTPSYQCQLNNYPFTEGEVFLFEHLPIGSYLVTLIDANACVYQEYIEITEPLDPDLAIEVESYTMNFGKRQYIELTINAPVTVQEVIWSHPQLLQPSTSFMPLFTPNTSGIFELEVTVIDINGCVYTAAVIIDVVISQFFPDIFSPNGDGMNDFFYPQGIVIDNVEKLSIYSRWGNKVCEKTNFQSNIPELGWDGTFNGVPSPTGVYVWHSTIRLADGSVIEREGDVTLVR